MKTFYNLILIIIALFVFISKAYSQECKNAYHKCKSIDKSFQVSTRSKSVNLFKGETKEFVLTLFKGFDYHIAMCSKQKIKNLQFKVRESNETKDILYDNAIEEFNPFKEFSMEETKKIILEVTVPPGKTPSENRERICIGVLIEYKK